MNAESDDSEEDQPAEENENPTFQNQCDAGTAVLTEKSIVTQAYLKKQVIIQISTIRLMMKNGMPLPYL